MEEQNQIKVLLNVNNNNFKVTIKTTNFTKSVSFYEFKQFLDEKYRQLFSDKQFAWKIYDKDFNEYLDLEESSTIHDLSKLMAVPGKDGPIEEPKPVPMPVNVAQTLGPPQKSAQPGSNAPGTCVDFQEKLIRSQNEEMPLTVKEDVFTSTMQREREFMEKRHRAQQMPLDPYCPRPQTDMRGPLYDGMSMHQRPSGVGYGLPFRPYGNISGIGERSLVDEVRSGRLSQAVDRMENYYNRSRFGYQPTTASVYDRRVYPHTYSDFYSNYPYDTSRSRSRNRSSFGGQPMGGYMDHYGRGMTERERMRERDRERDRDIERIRGRQSEPSRRANAFTPRRSVARPPSPKRKTLERISRVSKPTLKSRPPPVPAKASIQKPRLQQFEPTSCAPEGKSTINRMKVKNVEGNIFKHFFVIKKFTTQKNMVDSIIKYIEEFDMLSKCEDVWETDQIWNFVAKEISSKEKEYDAGDVKKSFEHLIDQYYCILEQLQDWQEKDAQELWMLFNVFHRELDLRPFRKGVVHLRKIFNAHPKKKIKLVASADAKNENDKPKQILKRPEEKTKVQQANENKKLIESVSGHIEDFQRSDILESDVWQEVATDMNEFESALLEGAPMSWRNKFYSLLGQYLASIMKDSRSMTEEDRAVKLMFSTLKINCFLEEFRKMQAEKTMDVEMDSGKEKEDVIELEGCVQEGKDADESNLKTEDDIALMVSNARIESDAGNGATLESLGIEEEDSNNTIEDKDIHVQIEISGSDQEEDQ